MAIKPTTSIFSGINNEKRRANANYIKQGKYWLLIDKCKIDQTRKNEMFAVNDFRVIHVINDNNKLGHQVGEECCHFIKNYGNAADAFKRTINEFIGGVLGVAAPDVTEDIAVSVYDLDQQPLAGSVVEVTAQQILLRKKQASDPDTMFTLVFYNKPITFAEVKERLTPAEVQQFWPGDELDKKIAAENAPAAAAA